MCGLLLLCHTCEVSLEMTSSKRDRSSATFPEAACAKRHGIFLDAADDVNKSRHDEGNGQYAGRRCRQP